MKLGRGMNARIAHGYIGPFAHCNYFLSKGDIVACKVWPHSS